MKVTSNTGHRVSLTWPDDDERILLAIIGEEDEEPIDLTYLAAELVAFGWAKTTEATKRPGREFAVVTYPEALRAYVDGRRIALDTLHAALSVGVTDSIRVALDRLEVREDNPQGD